MIKYQFCNLENYIHTSCEYKQDMYIICIDSTFAKYIINVIMYIVLTTAYAQTEYIMYYI